MPRYEVSNISLNFDDVSIHCKNEEEFHKKLGDLLARMVQRGEFKLNYRIEKEDE